MVSSLNTAIFQLVLARTKRSSSFFTFPAPVHLSFTLKKTQTAKAIRRRASAIVANTLDIFELLSLFIVRSTAINTPMSRELSIRSKEQTQCLVFAEDLAQKKSSIMANAIVNIISWQVSCDGRITSTVRISLWAIARLSSFLVLKQGTRCQLKSTRRNITMIEYSTIMAVYPTLKVSILIPTQIITSIYCIVSRIMVLRAVKSIYKVWLLMHWHLRSLYFWKAKRIPRTAATRKVTTNNGVKFELSSTDVKKAFNRYIPLAMSAPSSCL